MLARAILQENRETTFPGRALSRVSQTGLLGFWKRIDPNGDHGRRLVKSMHNNKRARMKEVKASVN
jgi:hypothetical protein